MKREWAKNLNLSPGFSEQKCFIQVNSQKYSCHILGMEWKNEGFLTKNNLSRLINVKIRLFGRLACV